MLVYLPIYMANRGDIGNEMVHFWQQFGGYGCKFAFCGKIEGMDTLILAANSESGVPALGFLGWIIIGGLAGWIGSKIMGTDAQMGLLANIVVGIIGGFLGGWLFTLIGIGSGGWIFSFITCLIGACILLWILKLVMGRR